MSDKANVPVGWIVIGFVGLVVLGLVFGAFYTVGSGEKAAEFSRSDGVQEKNYDEGLHWKIPVWESVEIYDVQKQTERFEEISSPTNERQEVFVTALVTYHINRSEVWQYHKYIGHNTAMEKLHDSTETELKAATVQRTVHENLLDRQQDRMENEIQDNLSAEMGEYHITITDVDIPNIAPSEAWISANEKKVIAKEKAIEEKHREKAELARHNQTIIKAEAEAESIAVKAQAEAERIEKIRNELPQGAGYNQWLAIDQWDGELPRVYAGGGEQSGVMDVLVPSDTIGR